MNTPIPFYQLTLDQRLAQLLDEHKLTQAEVELLKTSTHPDLLTLSDQLIENVVGCFPLPLGLVTRAVIDGKPRLIPLAVEETSIVAALNKTAKWVAQHGSITTHSEGDCIIGQIHFPHLKDWPAFEQTVAQHQADWVLKAHQGPLASLVQRGGGIQKIQAHKHIKPDGNHFAVIHVHMNPCDAMGANKITQVCEYLKPFVEQATGEKALLCILSNYNEDKITHARIEVHNVPESEGLALAEASLFAYCDPYRATTSNKGVMNGIDPILIATGNDWRAVEAGIHAYAARDGQYRSLTQWTYQNGTLTGTFQAPLLVGTVGGVTRAHPLAQLCLKLMGVQKAKTLAQCCAAVGLLQNLGALRALCGEGLIQGHMKLHLDNLLINAGANPEQIRLAKPLCENYLKQHGHINAQIIKSFLNEIL